LFFDVAGFQPGGNPDFSAGSSIFKIQLRGNLKVSPSAKAPSFGSNTCILQPPGVLF
jgi:hypothetical protein